VVDVEARFTVCVTLTEVLPENSVLPPYTAVNEWLPPVNVDTVVTAAPPESVAVPMTVLPSLNVTVPVGVPVPELGLTTALRVTDCPYTDGFKFDVSTVVVTAGPVGALTVCVIADELLPEKFVAPPYDAVSECAPAVKLETANVAVPLESVAVPRTVVPSRNVIVPVGVPVPGDTAFVVAVSVTDWFRLDGLGAVVSAVVVEI
jgi:hypothetical protein